MAKKKQKNKKTVRSFFDTDQIDYAKRDESAPKLRHIITLGANPMP